MLDPILQHVSDHIYFNEEYMSNIYRKGLEDVHVLCYNDTNLFGNKFNNTNYNYEKPKIEKRIDDDDEIICAMLSNNKIDILKDTLIQSTEKKVIYDDDVPESFDNSTTNLLFNTTDNMNIVKDTTDMPEEKEVIPIGMDNNDNNSQNMGNNDIKTIYKLFEYLKDKSLDRIRLEYNEIYETIYNKAKPFVEEITDNKERLEEIIDTYISKMVLDMITLDKVGFKADGMIEKVKSLYFINEKDEPIKNVKNDYKNYDYINRLISLRCEEQKDMSNDKLYNRFSQVKKRGRRNKVKPEDVLNPIETVTTAYITSDKAGPNTKNQVLTNNTTTMDDTSPPPPESTNLNKKSNVADYYPIFSKTLEIMNKLIPKSINHGYFLENTINCIRNLDPTIWPAQKFIEKINNMEYIYHEKIKLVYDESKKRYYCCMSELPISSGEEVNWYRIVESNVDRFKVSNKLPDGTPFENPNFKESITSFFTKTNLTSLHNIFCTPIIDDNNNDDNNNPKILIKPSNIQIKKNLKPANLISLNNTPQRQQTPIDESIKPKKYKPKKIKSPKKQKEKTKAKDKENENENTTTRKRNIEKLEDNPEKVPKNKHINKKAKSDNKSSKSSVCDNELIKTPLKENKHLLNEKNVGLHMKRDVSINVVWKKMLNIYRAVVEGDLNDFLWHNFGEKKYTKNYKVEHDLLYPVFNDMTDNNFKEKIEKILFYYVLTSTPIHKDTENIEKSQKDCLVKLFDIVLDFIDILFNHNENIINNDEYKNERIMSSITPSSDSKFKYSQENVLLRNLFLCSDDRRIIHKRKKSENVFFKMIKEKNSLTSIEYFSNYIFFFIILFSFIL